MTNVNQIAIFWTIAIVAAAVAFAAFSSNIQNISSPVSSPVSMSAPSAPQTQTVSEDNSSNSTVYQQSFMKIKHKPSSTSYGQLQTASTVPPTILYPPNPCNGSSCAINSPVTISGTAPPGSSVTVTWPNSFVTGISDQQTGAWSTGVTLSPGGPYTISITDTVNGVTSSPTSITIFVANPSSTSSGNVVSITRGAGASGTAPCVAANNCVSPNTLTVPVGTTVTWINNDTIANTVTSGLPTDNNTGTLFDSGLIQSGNTFQFTFSNSGTYGYFSTVHPWVKGQVIVGNGANTPPSSPATSSNSVSMTLGAAAGANTNCVAANNCFDPSVLNVAQGDTVTWTNNDKVSHTVTSGNVTDNNTGSLFDSGLVKPGKTFQFTFANAGTFDYFCTVHPWMTGKIIVTHVSNSRQWAG